MASIDITFRVVEIWKPNKWASNAKLEIQLVSASADKELKAALERCGFTEEEIEKGWE